MSLRSSEKLTSSLIAATLIMVTVIVFTQSVTDPVNVTKLFALGALSFAALGAATKLIGIAFLRNNRVILSALGLFMSSALSTLMASNAPFSQSFYGVYGRNNGFLLYFLLALIFVSTLAITHQEFFSKLPLALIVAGTINVIYAIWVLAFGDFIGWSNPYGNLLGTLGNPNFIGSFFGMFAALLFTYVVAEKESKFKRISAVVLLPLVFVGIIQSHAVQGKVLFISGAAIVGFYFLRDKFQSQYVSLSYLLLAASGFVFALMGTLQKGPLSSVLYKETVSLRGEYWHAGWQTGLSNPIFGAGFDSYGDWYRRSRRESALTLPGIDTVSNTAHNVYLDIFAFGGWPLLISYALLSLLVIVSILKFTLRNKKFDSKFVGLTSVWICYQLQSTISINQIGLAIWGWIFGAAIIAYERNDHKIAESRSELSSPDRSMKGRLVRSKQEPVISAGLIAGVASVVGMLLAVPPLSADMRWRSAQNSQDANRVEALLTSSYLNPLNTFEFNNIVGVFESNGLTEIAHKAGLEAVKFNPNSFEAWRNITLLTKSTETEKSLAYSNMKRLDPLNTTIGSAK